MLAKPHKMVKLANNKVVLVIIALRPNLSDKGPDSRAPMDIPTSAALRTGANCGLVMPQSSNNAGAIKPIIPVSKPSQKNTKKPKINTSHCNGESLSRSIIVFASIFFIVHPCKRIRIFIVIDQDNSY